MNDGYIKTIPVCPPHIENTPNTTVISAPEQYTLAIAVSEAVWKDHCDPMMRPKTVIIARGDGYNYQDALISSSLTHFLNNGPLLLTPPDNLSPIVAQELVRLNPTGHNSPAQVLTIGSLSESIDEAVLRLGFTVYRINGGDPAATAVMVWDALGKMDRAVLTSGETFEEALPAGGWAAYYGDPILLTSQDQLPMITANAIKVNQPDIYILGSEKTVSRRVEIQVRELTGGFVDRIGGNTPAEVSVNFTRYKSPTKRFGWGVGDCRGWSFRFSRSDDWASALTGNSLSHMGKPLPLLLINPNSVPPVVRQYITSVNSIHSESKPLFMHGYIVGIYGSILCPVQLDLNGLLEPVRNGGEI